MGVLDGEFTRKEDCSRIPPIRHRWTFGGVEITRGCGRGCQFCSVALRAGKEQILGGEHDHIGALGHLHAHVFEGLAQPCSS